jgi:RimJ/RimL family protein N-acetyltransferase
MKFGEDFIHMKITEETQFLKKCQALFKLGAHKFGKNYEFRPLQNTEEHKQLIYSVFKAPLTRILSRCRKEELSEIWGAYTQGNTYNHWLVYNNNQFRGRVILRWQEEGKANWGITLLEASRGKGIGTVVGKEVMKLAFKKFGFQTLYASCLRYNSASCRLMLKLAMTPDGKSNIKIEKAYDKYSLNFVKHSNDKDGVQHKLHQDAKSIDELILEAQQTNDDILARYKEIRELHKENSILKTCYQISVTFKVIDLMADVIRCYAQPTKANIANSFTDSIYLFSMLNGINKASFIGNIASISYRTYEYGWYKGAESVVTSAIFVSMSYVLTLTGVPFVGLVFSVAMASYSFYNSVNNLWSLYLELTANDAKLKSVQAYYDMYQTFKDITDVEYFQNKANKHVVLINMIKEELQDKDFVGEVPFESIESCSLGPI